MDARIDLTRLEFIRPLRLSLARQARRPGFGWRASATAALALAVCLVLGGCGGVPLSSVPYLMSLQQQLLDGDPADFTFAAQAEQKVMPRSDAVPTLDIVVRPAEGSTVTAFDRRLPMRLLVSSRPEGLPAAPVGRHWLVYALTPESQQQLAQLQQQWRAQMRAAKVREGGKGGTVSIGITQSGLAPDDPALQHTKWNAWLRTSRTGGFHELWSGTLAELKAQGRTTPAR